MQRTEFCRSTINRHSYLATLALLVLAGCNMLWDSCLQCPDDEPNCAAEPLVSCPSLQLNWKNPTPQGSTIKGMWGSATDNIWAVTEAGTFMRYDGTNWNNIPNVSTSAEMTAMSGSAADNIWAVGHRDTVMRYDGTSWSAVPVVPPSTDNLYGVWVSQDDVWAVGNGGNQGNDIHALHYHRSMSGGVETWKLSIRNSSPDKAIRAVWGSSNSDLWIVGDRGSVLHVLDGAWSASPSPTTNDLKGIWGLDKNRIWAVGSGGTIIKYDGSGWMPVTTSPGQTLHAIHGVDEDSMIAVGAENTILRGASIWARDPVPTGENINYYAAWVADSSGKRWAAGSYGRIISTASAPPSWTAMLTSAGNWRGTSSVWMQPTGDLWIASRMAQLYRLSTTGAPILSQNSGMPIASATGLWGTPGDKVFVSSSGATNLAICTPTDCSEHSAALPGGTPASKVWAASESDLWVVQGSKLSHWNGTSWNSLFDAAHPLSAIWGFSSTDIWAAGEAGELAHWDGSAWTEFLSPDTDNFHALWGSGPSDVWAVGDFGAAVHWDGSKWTKNNTGLDSQLMSVSGSGPNDVWATGERLFRWDGARWSIVFSAPESSPMQVWVQSQCNAWVAAEGGSIVNIH